MVVVVPNRHALTPAVLEDRVDNRLGVFELSAGEAGPVGYVGMTSDLVQRLRGRTDEYTHFSVAYQPDRTAAYEHLCRRFHELGGTESLENDQHPPRPHRRVECPICDIHD